MVVNLFPREEQLHLMNYRIQNKASLPCSEALFCIHIIFVFTLKLGIIENKLL